jgi:hypothetical protein
MMFSISFLHLEIFLSMNLRRILMTHEYRQFNLFKSLLLLSTISLLGGCGGNPPVDRISAAEQSLNQANMSEGDRYAPLEMRLAQEKLGKAHDAMHDKDYERAAALADEAMINAKLASAKADSARSTAKLEELKKSIGSLRQEIGTQRQMQQIEEGR